MKPHKDIMAYFLVIFLSASMIVGACYNATAVIVGIFWASIVPELIDSIWNSFLETLKAPTPDLMISPNSETIQAVKSQTQTHPGESAGH